MFRSFFLTLLLLASGFSYTMPVLLKAPQTPMEEFSAYIKTENITSYSNAELEKIQSQSEDIKNLRALLDQAQKSFLKDHLNQSGDYFRSIVKMAYKKDWVDEAKKIIFYSFLRLAQIEWKGLEAEAFLYSASIFAPHFNPEIDLFPPPLIQKFRSIKQKQSKLSVSLDQIFPFHDIVLINGRSFSMKEALKFPYGEYRVTALSSSHKKWSRVISLSQLVQKRIVTVPLVGGSCQHPVFSKDVDQSQALFPNFCLWSNDVKEIAKIDHSQFYVPNEIEKNIKDLENHKWKLYQKWGVLALVGIAAATAVIVFTDDREPEKKERPPKLKKGF